MPLALVFLCAVSIWRRRPTVIGRRGERRVSSVLAGLPSSRYKVLNDVLLLNSNRSSQIDHLVISRCGIFVIETKNIRGWIHGSESATTWTQTIYRNKYKFLNPIHQNLSHVRGLRALLNYPSHVPIFPVVVISGSGVLKNVQVNSPVIYVNELKKFIELAGDEILSDEQVENLLEKIRANIVGGKESRKLHVFHVRNRMSKSRRMIKEGTCPRCGGLLISRDGRYGRFLGCNNYPKCRFTSKNG